MRACGRLGRNMAKESTPGRMEQFSKVIFGWTNDKAKELFSTPMVHVLKATGIQMFETNNFVSTTMENQW